jgi:hypothetical protein
MIFAGMGPAVVDAGTGAIEIRAAPPGRKRRRRRPAAAATIARSSRPLPMVIMTADVRSAACFSPASFPAC